MRELRTGMGISSSAQVLDLASDFIATSASY